MMKVLYYDCFAGISGDMNLGALIDLGVPEEYLVSELEKLGIVGFKLLITQDQRRGITGTKAEVIVDNPDNENHRHLRHIEELVNSSSLPDRVKVNSLEIFDRVAVAEAKVHGISKEKVHFHEVGALDSIADIVGAAICLDYLKVDRIVSSPVQLGGGTVKCAHGIMPVPAPATSLILENIPVKKGLVDHEATTPTGAAILAAMVDEFTEDLAFPIVRTAYGIGNRDHEVPNVLRVFLCEGEKDSVHTLTENAILLESNIDDMKAEHYDFLMEKLFAASAMDVWLTPIIMKKSRPAVVLSVLCAPEKKNELKEIIFKHSTTLGIREQSAGKSMLKREFIVVNTPYGDVKVKNSYYGNQLVTQKPESDDCRRLAEEHGISIAEMEKAVIKSIET